MLAIRALKEMLNSGMTVDRSLVQPWLKQLPMKIGMKIEILCNFPHYALAKESYKMWKKPFHPKPKNKPGKFVSQLLKYRREQWKNQIQKSKEHDWQRQRQLKAMEEQQI